MNLDTTVDADESEHFVTVNRVTASGQRKVESFQVPVDDQYVILVVLRVGGLLYVEAFRTAVADFFALLGFPLLHVKVLVDDVVHVHRFVGNTLIEVGYGLEAQFPNQTHQDGLIIFQLPVLEFTFQCLLGKLCLTGCNLLQGLTYLVACLRRGDKGQPVTLRCLRVRSHDFHLVATVQFLAELYIFPVDAGTRTPASQVGVDRKGKVEHGSPLRQFVQVTFRSKYEYLVLI